MNYRSFMKEPYFSVLRLLCMMLKLNDERLLRPFEKSVYNVLRMTEEVKSLFFKCKKKSYRFTIFYR